MMESADRPIWLSRRARTRLPGAAQVDLTINGQFATDIGMPNAPHSENTKQLVITTVRELRDQGLTVLLGGGWAKEFLGLIEPRAHKDIDLYFLDTDLCPIDAFIAARGYEEIPQKHLRHKRAFLKNGVMVEIVLIRRTGFDYYSPFSPWGGTVIHWPTPLCINIREAGISCLSVKALSFYSY
jgi:hypothetical protein